MYNAKGTIVTAAISRAITPTLLGSRIQVLDVNKNCFYGAFSTTLNGPLVILPSAVKPDNVPCISTEGCKGLASSVFKSSVVFMYADTLGVYLDYHAPSNGKNESFSLFVEWKEIGVLNLSQSYFDSFLCHLKRGMLQKHFITILSKSNKAKKAVFKAIDSIAFSLFEQYDVGNNCRIETGYHGGWDLIRGLEIIQHDACLEQLTLKLVKH